jgi:hypothetical protein
LVLLGKASVGELALDAGIVDKAWDIDSARFVPLFRDNHSPAAAKLLAGFEAALIFADGSSPLLLTLRNSGISELHSQPPFPGKSGEHVADYHLSLFADPVTLAFADRTPRLVPSGRALAAARNLLPAEVLPVAMHPGSGSQLKNWPLARFRQVADRLRARGFPIAWIRGPADGAFDVPGGDILIDNVPLSVLAAEMSRF